MITMITIKLIRKIMKMSLAVEQLKSACNLPGHHQDISMIMRSLIPMVVLLSVLIILA